jgi:hypothetical protein
MSIISAIIDPDNATAGDRITIWQNGVLSTAVNVATDTPANENAATDLTIGARSLGDIGMDGQIGSVILFNTPTLPTADRELLENYLIDLQGIT